MATAGQPTPNTPLGQAPLELITLGAVALVRPDGQPVLPVSKQLAVLTYILAAPGRSATRDQLAALLWGDSATRNALASLRSTLFRLRAAIGDHPPDANASIVRLGVPIAADFQVFEAALRAGDLPTAVQLYTGPFFRDYSDAGTREFEHWADIMRARLEAQFLQAGETCIADLLARGNSTEAIRLAAHLQRHAPGSEAARRLHLGVLLSVGRRLDATAEAADLEAWLAAEHRLPEPATARLLESLSTTPIQVSSPEAEPARLVAELVGREREFSRILDAWATVERGTARHIHLVAPPGLGKTRLLDDVAHRLVASGATVVRVRAYPGERSMEYSLAADLARGLADYPETSGITPASLAVLVALQPALGLRYPSVKPASPTSDLLLQRTLAVREQLASITEARRVVLVVDDLHWCDPPSRQILVSISQHLAPGRILLLTAGRPGRLDPDWAEHLLPLPPLSRVDIEGLLQSLGAWDSIASSLRVAEALHQATGGSPLLCLEALQLASERGDLTLAEGTWHSPNLDRLTAQLRTAGARTARLELLAAEPKRLLLVLATAGLPLPSPRLAAMLEWSPEALQVTLDLLEKPGYVQQTPEGWELAHDELADAISALATEDERRAAHGAVGRTLAAEPTASSSGVRRIARHLIAAGANPELRAAFARWVAECRHRGDGTPARQLALEFLGPTSSPELLGQLVKDLPARLRVRRQSSRVLAAGLVLLLLAAGALGAWRLFAPPPSPPDAELLVADTVPGRRIALYRVPIWKDRWKGSEPIVPEPRMMIGMLPPEVQPFRLIIPSNDGKLFAFSRVMPDSGGIDLFLWSVEGGLRRLTATPGDDVNPTWSPDDRYLAFGTARWTPRGDDDADIAVLDLSTGGVRQLTRGSAYDNAPLWSPDGTRIAFVRDPAVRGGAAACWVTFDAAREHCNSGELPPGTVPVAWWDSGSSLELGGSSVRGHVRWEVETDSMAPRWEGPTAVYAGDNHAGMFLRELRSPRTGVALVEGNRPDREHFVPSLLPNDAPSVMFITGSGTTAAAAPRIVPALDTVFIGVPRQMDLVRPVSGREPVVLDRGVTSWSISPGAGATIDSATGMLLALQPGTFTVVASAGGWSRDSLRLIAVSPTESLLVAESWGDPTLRGWESFGEPLPMVVRGPDSVPAFLHNGDGVFDSGALGREGFSARGGLALEALVSTPITATKWQRLNLELMTGAKLSVSGFGGEQACSVRIPQGEGSRAASQWSASASPSQRIADLTPAMRSGAWYRMLIQIFPGGSCGVAIDGKAVWRSEQRNDPTRKYHVEIQGQSVGTRILVGPFTLWRGIRSGVDWTRLLPAGDAPR